MRQMLTEKEVKEVVIKGIESGEIVAGLNPEQEAKLNNSLQLPAEAPASQVLVGVNSSKEQNSMSIGEGLSINNGVIENDVKKLVIDFGTETGIIRTVSSDVYNKILNKYYDIITIKNFTSQNFNLNFIQSQSLVNNNYISFIEAKATGQTYFGSSLTVSYYTLESFTTDQIIVRTNDKQPTYYNEVLIGTSGTMTSDAINYFTQRWWKTITINFKASNAATYEANIEWKTIDRVSKYAEEEGAGYPALWFRRGMLRVRLWEYVRRVQGILQSLRGRHAVAFPSISRGGVRRDARELWELYDGHAMSGLPWSAAEVGDIGCNGGR